MKKNSVKNMKGTSSSSSSIPSKVRETVQNLKEIVNCTEQEIYSMLRECHMDPNETVNKLLNQDTFHVVKSKREKKKETKASGESRSQRVSISSGHGVMVGPDHAGWSVLQINSNDCEVTRAKHVHVSENGARIGHTSSGFGSGGATNNYSALSTSTSSYLGAGNSVHFPGLTDNVFLPSQASSTLQHKWLAVPGQLSMADVVKTKWSQRKPSKGEVHKPVLHQPVVPNTLEDSASASARCISSTIISSEAAQETHSLHDNNEPGILVGQHESLEEWTFVDHSTVENYHGPSASTILHIDKIDSHLNHQVEDIQKLGCVGGRSISTESTISDVLASLGGSEGSSCSDDGSFTNISYDQHDEAEDVELSLATSNLHHLSLHKEQQDEAPAVIIPSHLQDTYADCSHLSFGSFGSDVCASTSKLEVTSVTENAPAVDYSDTSTEELRTASDNDDLSISGTTCSNSDVVSTSQPELSRDNTPISERKLQFTTPSFSSVAPSVSVPPSDVDYNHKHAWVNLPVQKFAPLTSLPQPHLDSTSLNLLGGNAQPLREPELPSLHLQANQSVPTKYIPAVPSFGTTISSPEHFKPGFYSNFQPIPQTASSTTISSVPPLPSYDLLAPTYSQQTLSRGPMAPQNIAYMQSPASDKSARIKYLIPQYKSHMALNGLPQSLPVGSGYGGYGSYGSSTNSSRTFLQNPLNAAAGMSVGYDEALRSQWVPLQEGGNISMSLRGSGSQSQPTFPTNSFYGIQEHGHQGSNLLRQAQHPIQMGSTGYANLYHTQQLGGISRDPQQLREPPRPLRGQWQVIPILQENMNGSQGQSSQKSYQQWEDIY